MPVREIEAGGNLPRLSLRQNFSSTLAGNIIYSGCQWLAVIVIARLGTPEMVGQFALGIAISTPILTCCSLQLRAVQVTDASNTYQFSDFLSLRAVGTSFAILLIFGAVLFSSWSFQSRIVVIILGLRAAIESFSDITYGYFQKQERLDIIAKGMILRAATGVTVLAAALWISKSLIVGALFMTGAWLAGLLIYEFPRAMKSLSWTPRLAAWKPRSGGLFKRTRPLILLSLPLAIVMFLLSSSQSISRLFLENYAGERILGFFSAVATLSGGLGLIYIALGQAALPTLSKMYLSDSSQFAKLLIRMLLLAAVPGIIIVAIVHIFGSRILGAAYGSAFAGYGGLLTGLTFVAVLNNVSTLLGLGATASLHYWPQLTASIFILAAALISGFCLIPRGGPSGAMYSVLITAIVQLAAYGVLCARIIGKTKRVG